MRKRTYSHTPSNNTKHQSKPHGQNWEKDIRRKNKLTRGISKPYGKER